MDGTSLTVRSITYALWALIEFQTKSLVFRKITMRKNRITARDDNSTLNMSTSGSCACLSSQAAWRTQFLQIGFEHGVNIAHLLACRNTLITLGVITVLVLR